MHGWIPPHDRISQDRVPKRTRRQRPPHNATLSRVKSLSHSTGHLDTRHNQKFYNLIDLHAFPLHPRTAFVKQNTLYTTSPNNSASPRRFEETDPARIAISFSHYSLSDGGCLLRSELRKRDTQRALGGGICRNLYGIVHMGGVIALVIIAFWMREE